ncbi:MAG: helix-turn-helix domain-containing protein [Phycisphaerae bacterium]
MRSMTGLKKIIDYLDITILNAELYTVGTEWNYRNVSNPYSRLYCITQGSGAVFHHGRRYELTPGRMYLIPCYTTVDMFCDKAFTHYYIHFTSRLPSGLDIFSMFECGYEAGAQSLLANDALFERLVELNPGKGLIERNANRPIYRQVLEQAVKLDNDKTAGSIFEINGIMRLLISAFFSGTMYRELEDKLHGIRRFEAVLEHVQQNMDAQLSVPELAAIAGLSPTYFSNLFSRLIGEAPVQYINRRRIERAQELLLTTDEKLYAVAARVGMKDEYYFSRLFKKIVGISPDHYRRQEQAHHRR